MVSATGDEFAERKKRHCLFIWLYKCNKHTILLAKAMLQIHGSSHRRFVSCKKCLTCVILVKMRLLFAICLLSISIEIAVGLLGRTQSAAVKGKLICRGKPAAGVKVKLYDDDRGAVIACIIFWNGFLLAILSLYLNVSQSESRNETRPKFLEFPRVSEVFLSIKMSWKNAILYDC